MDPENPKEPENHGRVSGVYDHPPPSEMKPFKDNQTSPLLVENEEDVPQNGINIEDETNGAEANITKTQRDEEEVVTSPDFPPPPPPPEIFSPTSPPPPPEENEIVFPDAPVDNAEIADNDSHLEPETDPNVEIDSSDAPDNADITENESHPEPNEIHFSDGSIVYGEITDEESHLESVIEANGDADSTESLTDGPNVNSDFPTFQIIDNGPGGRGPEDRNGDSDVLIVTRPSLKKRYVENIEDNDKETYTNMCLICMFLLILASVAAAFIGIIWIPMLEPTQEIIVGEGGFFSAQVTVNLDMKFSDNLYISTSPAYIELEQEYFNGIENALLDTEFRSTFYGTIVSGFRPGSIIVHSSLYFVSNTDLLPRLKFLEDQLMQSAENGDFGNLAVNTITVNKVSKTTNDTKSPIKIAKFPSTTLPSAEDLSTTMSVSIAPSSSTPISANVTAVLSTANVSITSSNTADVSDTSTLASTSMTQTITSAIPATRPPTKTDTKASTDVSTTRPIPPPTNSSST